MHPPDDDNLTPATASSVEEGARALEEGMAEAEPRRTAEIRAATREAGPAKLRPAWTSVAAPAGCSSSSCASRASSTWTGFGAIMPYLPLFLKEEAHSSMLLIGVIAVDVLRRAPCSSRRPWAGLSDTVGRKPIMVFGVALVRRRHGAVHDDQQPLVVRRFSASSKAWAPPPRGRPATPSSPTSLPRTRGAARPSAG